MSNTSSTPTAGKSWSASEVIGQKNDWMERLLGWWYRFTTPPRPAEEASFAQRETERRARMLSTVGFFLVVILLALLPPLLLILPVPCLLASFFRLSSLVLLWLTELARPCWQA